MSCQISNYGGLVLKLEVPDRGGQLTDVVLGYDDLADYLKGSTYFGAIVGRYGNRIGQARFTLKGREYTLARNDGPNNLHGGFKGFDKVLWQANLSDSPEGPRLELSYQSPDGEEGFPGNVSVTVTYTLTQANELKIDYLATTDQDTVVNLTHHSYFNLAGADQGDILDHELMIAADRFTPVDEGLIPTGELRPVAGTAFDFTQPTRIGLRIDDADPQLKFGGGYDHNWVLNKGDGSLALAARLTEPTSGRVMEVWTTEPGLQFYSGNLLGETSPGKNGHPYKRRDGLCLETQHFPDSPNQPGFPSTVLRTDQTYTSTTIYRFSINNKNA